MFVYSLFLLLLLLLLFGIKWFLNVDYTNVQKHSCTKGKMWTLTMFSNTSNKIHTKMEHTRNDKNTKKNQIKSKWGKSYNKKKIFEAGRKR